jgi:hypothetical protein
MALQRRLDHSAHIYYAVIPTSVLPRRALLAMQQQQWEPPDRGGQHEGSSVTGSRQHDSHHQEPLLSDENGSSSTGSIPLQAGSVGVTQGGQHAWQQQTFSHPRGITGGAAWVRALLNTACDGRGSSSAGGQLSTGAGPGNAGPGPGGEGHSLPGIRANPGGSSSTWHGAGARALLQSSPTPLPPAPPPSPAPPAPPPPNGILSWVQQEDVRRLVLSDWGASLQQYAVACGRVYVPDQGGNTGASYTLSIVTAPPSAECAAMYGVNSSSPTPGLFPPTPVSATAGTPAPSPPSPPAGSGAGILVAGTCQRCPRVSPLVQVRCAEACA